MRIPFQCSDTLYVKAMIGVFLGSMTLLPSLPNAQEQPHNKPQTSPLLLVLVRPFIFSMHIVRTDLDGRVKTDLSQGDGVEAEPVLSPDGKQIAFTAVNANRSGADIYTMNLDGTGRTQITHSPAKMMAMSPAWSPNGSKLVYCAVSTEEQKPLVANLHVMAANGASDKIIGQGTFPVWTKDNKIACTREEKTGEAAYIIDINADGKNLKKLFSDALLGGWSSDGKRLLYTQGSNIHLAHVLVTNADGTHPIQVTGTEYEHEYGAQWAADNRHILFNRDVDSPLGVNTMQVFTADADGKNAKAITSKEDGLMLSNGSGMLLQVFRMAR
jgi:Tol biopolymer transport system component